MRVTFGGWRAGDARRRVLGRFRSTPRLVSILLANACRQPASPSPPGSALPNRTHARVRRGRLARLILALSPLSPLPPPSHFVFCPKVAFFGPVSTSRFVLDEQGMKMSKSLGNGLDPKVVVDGGKNPKVTNAFAEDVGEERALAGQQGLRSRLRRSGSCGLIGLARSWSRPMARTSCECGQPRWISLAVGGALSRFHPNPGIPLRHSSPLWLGARQTLLLGRPPCRLQVRTSAKCATQGGRDFATGR